MLMLAVYYLANKLTTFNSDERGQDAFEYVLVIGGVTVAVILAIATPVGNTMIKAVINGACAAIKGIPNMNSVSC